MLVESTPMTTKLGEDEEIEVELELCLSLGGPFKKTGKSPPIESRTDGKSNAVRCAKDADVSVDGGAIHATRRKETRKKRDTKQQPRSGECKRIRTECNGGPNAVDLGLSFIKMGNGYGTGQVRENSKGGTIGSPICSSSDVSDLSSSCRQEGGNYDIVTNSGQTKPVNNVGTGTEDDGSKDTVVMEAEETRKPPRARPSGNGTGVNGGLLPFARMPCVTSTGNGPEGKTINGFLYRYSKSEISIICVCHGTTFSPAEFIIHAGGTHVSHPLKHITVVPSTL